MPDLFERLRGQYSDSTGVQLNSPIDVSNQLRSESDEVILFVRGKINGPLRAISLTSFSGTVWTPDPGARSVYHDDQMVWEGDEGRMISDKDPWSPNGEVYMEIRNPMGRYLPTTVGPRGITGTSGFGIAYELGTDSLQATRDIQRGDTYTIQSTVLDRSGLTVIDVDRGIGPNALPLVNTPYQEEIRNFTVEIIGSASTQGEMLAAIESYLRGPEFVYTLSPSWTTTGDPVWDFLQNKQGYCIHFSTAMAVMAMSVGIPMRVSIGFLVSPSDVDAWVEVRNTNAHMWPEALYPELGWVRYEPTPSITGAGPGDPTTSPPEPSDGPTTPDGVSTIVPSDLPSNQPSTPNNENPGISSGGLGWILGLAVGVLIAAGVGFGVRTAYVRSYTPERSWRVIRRKAIKVGLISEGTSVRSALKKVATRCDPDLAQTLDEVREYLETTWYSPNSETPAPISSTTTARLTRAVVRHLRHT
jgi:transglutaminase-like putative cysteine protease